MTESPADAEPHPLTAAGVNSDTPPLDPAGEEAAARLAFEQSPGDVRAAQRLVAALLAQDKPLPDDLHETALRLQLRERPHDMALTYSLVALLCRLGRAPVPDYSAPDGPRTDEHALTDLLRLAEDRADANDPFGVYAALWQACVRHPGEMRGWIEFARRFGDNREWSFCRAAANHIIRSTNTPDLPTATGVFHTLRLLAQQSELADLEWKSWMRRLPDQYRLSRDGIDVLAQLGALPEEAAARLIFEQSPGDVRAAQRLVAALLAQDKPLPDDLHETALRLQLRERPHDMALTYSLVALLCRLGRVPLPDYSAPDGPRADEHEFDDLLQLVEERAQANDPFGVYAALWQVCVRHPRKTRGWSEFARRFADNREWSYCRAAANHVLRLTDPPDELTAASLLPVLRALERRGELADVRWKSWVARLPVALPSSWGAKQLLNKATRDASARLAKKVAMERLLKFINAYGHNDLAAAYDHLVEAIRSDPVSAWHEIVNSHSNKFNILLENTGKRSETGKILEELYGEFPDMITVPPPSDNPNILENMKNARLANIEKGLPYYLFIPQAKSGSTMFGNIVAQGLGLTCTTYSMISASVIPSWARDYARGGSSYITHLWPEAYNVKQLVRAGLKKAVVNTRDPRQAFLSQIHHMDIYRGDYPDLERAGFFSLSLNDRARHLIDHFNGADPFAIMVWIDGWITAETEGMELLFTAYEDFLFDRETIVERILDFIGGNRSHFSKDEAFSRNENIDYHFRQGEVDEWRRVFEPDLIKTLNDAIPSTWFEKFNWTP